MQAVSAVISDGGHEIVYAGGVASANSVTGSGGVLFVETGGRTIDTITSDGGQLQISAGGSANTNSVAGGGYEIVAGQVTLVTVSSGGELDVSSGGVASNTLVAFGGMEVISAGGTEDIALTNLPGDAAAAGTVTVASGGFLKISAGATGFGIDAHASGAVAVFGIASGPKVESGGLLDVEFRWYGRQRVISDGGHEIVYAGGVASANSVTGSGGVVFVESGGTAIDTIASGGGQVQISAGGSANTDLVAGGGYEIVEGHATLVTVSSGGYLDVSSGGVASSTLVAFGGTEIISAGGTETIGQTNMPGDASAAGTVIIASGAFLKISAGATGFGIDAHASGAAAVFGIASGAKVESGGVVDVESGGTAAGATVSDGGHELVDAGGVANADSITGSGGVLFVESGGTALDTIASDGGQVQISAGGSANTDLVAGGGYEIVEGHAALVTVSSGGDLDVSSGGIASNTLVAFGGTEIISAGGTEDIALTNLPGDTTAAGTVVIASGASSRFLPAPPASASTPTPPARQRFLASRAERRSRAAALSTWNPAAPPRVPPSAMAATNSSTPAGWRTPIPSPAAAACCSWNSGGTAIDTIASDGGQVQISAGGSANTDAVAGGGYEIVEGHAALVTVSSGGELDVSSGGIASNTLVAFGGTEIVSAGGTETIGLTNLPGDASAAGTVVVGSAGIVGVLSEVPASASMSTPPAARWSSGP